MAQNDKHPAFELRDIPAALGLLSRLPIKVDFEHARSRAALSVWAYPIVGIVIGAISGLIGTLAHFVGLPALAVAALSIAASIILTGAMHEDGLADSADGLWGGWDKDHRLKIMKDSFVGVYGVVAVGLSLVLRISLLAALVGELNLILACIGIGAISRAPMVALMFALPNARDEGLSASVGHAPAAQMAVALGLGSVVVVASLFTAGLFVIAMVTITTLLWAMIARAKIGGQTGDILGATQQLSEIAALIGLSIWLA